MRSFIPWLLAMLPLLLAGFFVVRQMFKRNQPAWQEPACLCFLAACLSVLILSASNKIDFAFGEKTALIQRRLDELNLVAENIADLAVFTARIGVDAGGILYTGADSATIIQTKEKVLQLQQSVKLDQQKIAVTQRKLDSVIADALTREFFEILALRGNDCRKIALQFLYDEFNAGKLTEALKKGNFWRSNDADYLKRIEEFRAAGKDAP